jgi:hypothetical protein
MTTDVNDWVKPEDRSIHTAQRATRGFSDWDWWSFDTYIAWVIANGLRKFRDDGIGYPGYMTEEQWVMILDIAIEGFDLAATKFDWTFGPVEDQREKAAKVNLALDIFKGIHETLWD